jgi:hypothetical protein
MMMMMMKRKSMATEDERFVFGKDPLSSGEHDPNRALHFSEGKSGVDQIPAEVLLEWGDVFTYGEKKYERDNWLQGNDWHEFYASAMRHMLSFWKSEDIDPESGLPHLSHAIWNLGALRFFQIHGLGEDDRPWLEEEEDKEREDSSVDREIVDHVEGNQHHMLDKSWHVAGNQPAMCALCYVINKPRAEREEMAEEILAKKICQYVTDHFSELFGEACTGSGPSSQD